MWEPLTILPQCREHWNEVGHLIFEDDEGCLRLGQRVTAAEFFQVPRCLGGGSGPQAPQGALEGMRRPRQGGSVLRADGVTQGGERLWLLGEEHCDHLVQQLSLSAHLCRRDVLGKDRVDAG